MAEPIVRSFVIDTTQAEQNLQRLDVVTTATNASLDGLYNQLIALDAQLQKLDPNSQAFAEVNTQIQQLETPITGIETGKIDDIGKAIESIDAGNAAALKAVDRPLFHDFWERFLACLDALRAKRIETRTLWQPGHLSPAHANAPRLPCPVAEDLYENCLSLPSSSFLNDEQVMRVIAAILDVCKAR